MRDFVFVGRFLKIACLKKIVGGAEKIPKVYVGGGKDNRKLLAFIRTHTHARAQSRVDRRRSTDIYKSVGRRSPEASIYLNVLRTGLYAYYIRLVQLITRFG